MCVCVSPSLTTCSASTTASTLGRRAFACTHARDGRKKDEDIMSLRDDILRDTKEAMRSRERPRIEALRMLSAALKNDEIDKGRTLSGDEEMAVLRRQLKQREESAEAFRKAGREEQAASEAAEAEIVRSYLPEPLSPEELEEIVDRAIKETGATGMRDMGAVMGRSMDLSGGRAEGRGLSALVRNRLQ